MTSKARAGLAATAAVITCGAGLALAPSASASGGGCSGYSTNGGATYKACISQAGSTIYYDGYVTSNTTCWAHVFLYEDGRPTGLQGPDVNCRGNFVHVTGPPAYTVRSGHTWTSYISVTTTNSYLRVSPVLNT